MKMGRLELLILMVVCTTVVVVCGQRSGPGPTPAPDGSDDPYPSRNGGMEQQPNGTNNCTDRPEICRYRHELKTWQDRQEDNGTDICQPLHSWSIDIAPESMRFCAGLGGCVVGEDCRQWTGLQCLPNTVFCPAANMCLPTNMSSSCKNGTVMCSSEQNEQFATYAGRHKVYSSWYKNDCVGCSWSHCRQIVGSLDCQHDEIAYCPTLRRCILENETCEGFRSLGAPPEPPAEEPGTDDPRTEETATDTVSESESESESEPRREATDEPRREATPTDESRREEQPTDESEWETWTEDTWTEEPWTEEPWTEEPGQDEPSTQEPSTLDPSTAGPSTLSTSKLSTSEPSTPSTSKPSTSEPSTPSTPKPLTSEPSTPEASTPMPSTPKPSTSKPSTPEPSTLQPSTEDPHGNGANPNCTMVFCAERGRCVPRDGSCHGDGKGVTGSPGQVFNLEAGRFVWAKKEELTCGNGEVFSLEAGRCVWEDTEKGEITCSNDEVFNAEVGACVSATVLDKTQATTCKPGEVFSAEVGRCVLDREFPPDSVWAASCGHGEVFSLEVGRCVPAPRAPDNTRASSCPQGQIFSLETGRCVPDKFTTTATVNKKRAIICRENEAFFMSANRCIRIMPSVASNDDKFICNGNEVFDLQTGRCVPRKLPAVEKKGTVTCRENEFFSLASGGCVARDPEMDSGPIQCKPGEVFCLSAGRCMPVSGDCGSGADGLGRPTAETESPSGRDDEAEPSVCGRKEIYCLSAGACVPETFCLHERRSDQQTTCGHDEVQVHVPDDGDCTSLCAKEGDEDGPIGIIKKEDGGGFKLQLCYTNKTVPQPSPEDDQQGAAGEEGARLKDLFQVCDPTVGSAAPRPPPMQCLADPPVLVFRYDNSYALSAAKDRAAKVFTKMNGNAPWKDMAISGARLSLNQYISFQPSSTTRGTVGIDISVQTGGRPAPGQQQRFTFKVTDNGVNDPPVFKAQKEFVAPSVPYDVDPSQWEGVTVAQVMGRFVDDEEQSQVGAAVVLSDLRSSDIGGWSVSPSGDPARFEELSAPSRIRRDASRTERLKLLGPNARVKFVPSADNSHWDFIQARQKTVLPIRAWDATAFQGGQVITYDPACPASEECGGSNSISKRKVRVIIEREGCDGRGGSGKKTDNCGVCGGDGTSCQGDCNGDVGGNAEKNKCDKCTGGATGKDASFGVDCAGKCDLYEVNERLGKCLPKGTRVAADCAGDFVLTDRAFINECDICVGGSTGKDKNFGKNECGRCDGTLDCVDCDDVVGGGKQVDDCGECLDPSDPNFNKGCISLSSVTPRILKAGAKTTLTVSGAGLQRIVNAKCKITSVSRGTQGELDDVRLKREDWKDQAFALTFDAPRAAGEFDLSCDLSGRDGTLVNKALDQDNRIIIIPSEGIQITRVQPDNTEIGGEEPIPVTITGQGFVDTGDAWCYAIHKRAAVQVPAEITSATEATCSLPPSEKSVRVKIGVSLEKPGDSKGRGTDDYNGAWFEYRAAAPQLQSARFSDNLALVTVVFDKAIEGPRECRGLFDRASAEKFGSAACRIVKGNTIVVKLGTEATLRPADQITLKADAITARMSEAGAAASGSVDVLGPETATVPRVELLGPSEVDGCTCLRLGARSFNTGGRTVSHRWTVEVDDASVDLTDLEAHLGGLTGDRHARLCKDQGLLESDKQYTFCVTVTNFLGAQSEVSCHTVQTLAEVHPFTARIAGSRRRQTIADRRLRLQANVVTPPDSCDQDVDSVTDSLNFRWEVVGSTDFNLDSFTGTLASITEGLKGGETYTVRFIAYSDTHSSEDTVDIVVRSRDLKPAIAGKTITIGSHQNVTLDGSGSRDPDNADGEEFFTWTCLERETALPCWVEVGGEPAPLPLSDEATTTVRGSMLNPNTWYEFTLSMRKGNRSASTAVELFVSPNEVPQVQVDPVPEKVNPDRRVVINFKLTTTMPDTTVTLECLEQEGYGYVDLEEVTANGKTSLTYPKPAAQQPVNVVILPNSLAPNTRYTFRATAVHQGGEAYADVVVETNAAPSPGDFQVEPAVGTALSDTFTLSAEGWTDDEDDALEYRFGYIGPDDRTVQLRGRTEDSQYEATLPAGIGADNELTLVVDVFDGRRASSRLTFDVTVNPPAEITDDTVDNVKGEIENSLLTGDVDKAMSSVISMVKTVKQVGGNLTEEQQDVVNELKAALTDKITETIPKDEEEVDNALRGLAGTYDADSNMGEEVRTKAKEYIGDLMEEFYRMEDEVSEDNNASARDDGQAKRRRKRNAANVVTTPMTTDQVSDMLLVFDAMLASIDESSPDAVTTKLDFRSTVELGMVGMCRGQSYGGSASVAQSGNVVVRTDLTLFDDIADQQLLASCDGCSGDVTGTPKIRLGEDVAWAYEQWQCVPDSSTVCYGACIGSAQIKFDPLTDPLSSDAIRSDLVLVDLVSPLSDLRTRLAGLRDPLVLDIPATGAMPDGTYTLECRRWAGNAWTTTGCSTNLVPRDVGGVPYVTCSCTFLGGYYALFEGEYVEPTTPAPVTSPPEKNAIEFTFVQNCSVVTSGDQAGFLVTFHDFIADKMRVSPTRVRNLALFDVIGVGCICTYDLLEASRPEDTINFYAVDAIAEMMWKRFLGAESPDGVPLDVYRSSLLKDGGMVNPARTAPIQKPATPGEIIAGLVCGLFLFLIMLGLACCFARAMVGKAKVEASPPNSPPNSARREAFVASGSSPPSGKMETYPRNMEKSSFHV